MLGPYKVETNSVLPNLENNDNGDAEDEVIWYSGGYFHIVYNYWNVRRAYHIMSKDGLSNWQSTGLAYEGKQSSPNANSDWVRYSDGTVNHWYNVERPGVLLENGHVTHFSFAVTDLDKDQAGQINTGGSKVLVVRFNGAQFDCDNGDVASCQDAAAGGSGGSSAGGAAGSAGQSGAGAAGTATMGGVGGTTAGAGAGGSEASGGATVGAGGSPAAGGGAGGTTSSVAGSPLAAAGTATSAGTGSLAATGPSNDGGCACRVGTSNRTDRMSWVALAAAAAVAVRRRARRRLATHRLV